MSWNRAENLDNKKLFIMRRESTILLSFLLGFCIVNAQQSSGTSYPTIGKLCPDFVLHNINYYKQGQAKLADFELMRRLYRQFSKSWSTGQTVCG
jgi:hypothetical protein